MSEIDLGYSLADSFIDEDIRAFTVSGAALRGVLSERKGKFVLIANENKSKAILNLDHTISLLT